MKHISHQQHESLCGSRSFSMGALIEFKQTLTRRDVTPPPKKKITVQEFCVLVHGTEFKKKYILPGSASRMVSLSMVLNQELLCHCP